MHEQFENANKIIEIVRSKLILELNNTIIELKNSLERINRRLNQAEERSSKGKDRLFEVIKSEEQKKKE